MKRAVHFVIVSALAAKALVFAQGVDVNKLLADAREALGGDQKLSAITSLTATGHTTRVSPDGSSAPQDFEMAMQLPDKYMKKETVAVVSGMSMSRTAGFNGNDPIELVDAPPGMMGGGGTVVRMIGPGGSSMGGTQTPEQQVEQRKNSLLASRQEFARITLGMFATSFKGYPLTFTYSGQAESPDGKADVIDVKGEGDFAAKLFIDTRTHLPLMLTWMAKEPLVMRAGPGGAGSGMVQFSGNPGQMNREQMMKDLEEQMKKADAARRIVEYRVYYGKYQTVDGLKLPSILQRSIDGKPSDEMRFEKIKLNPKIDPGKFQGSK